MTDTDRFETNDTERVERVEDLRLPPLPPLRSGRPAPPAVSLDFLDLTPTTAPSWGPPPRVVERLQRFARGTSSPPARRARPSQRSAGDAAAASGLTLRAVASPRRWGWVVRLGLDGAPRPARRRAARMRPTRRALLDRVAPAPVIGALATVAVLLGMILGLPSGGGRAADASETMAAARAPAATHQPTIEPIVEPLPARAPSYTPTVEPIVEPLGDPESVDEVVIDEALTAPRPATAHRVGVARAPAPAAPAAPAAAPAAEDVHGVLMVNAKPPCRIIVDGVDTGLMTPQRELTLPAGRHEVQLVNDEFDLVDTTWVTVRADRPTRLVRDLTGLLPGS